MSASRHIFLQTLILALLWPAVSLGQGLSIPGAGAAHRAMAGASTAGGVDAAGAIYWNPAAIGELPSNQVYFGAEVIQARTYLSSGVGPAAPGGRTAADNGISALPTIALVHRGEDSKMTLGLGVLASTGGGVNFPKNPANPVLNVLGPQSAALSGLMLAPTLAYELSDCLVVGAGPTIMTVGLSLDPAYWDPNAPGVFPAATHTHPTWGGGFRAGLVYRASPCLSYGLSYTTQQWLETLKYNATDLVGNPKNLHLDITFPQVFSFGVRYQANCRTVIAADVRYLDYAGTQTFGDRPVDGGLGWQSIWALATGVQYQLTDKVKLRMGYLYNQNPIPEAATLFNVQVPGFNQHQFSMGLGMRLTKSITTDFTWVHVFDASIEGPILPTQAINTAVKLEQSMDVWSLGLGIDF